jgi:hypothetical protein
MGDDNWYYEYFMQFVDKPAPPKTVSSKTASPSTQQQLTLRESQASAPRQEPAPPPVEGPEEETTESSSEESVEPETPEPERRKPRQLFGKAPQAVLAAIKRPGRATRPASLDLTAGRSRKRSASADEVDGTPKRKKAEGVKKVTRKPRLAETYPGLAKFK